MKSNNVPITLRVPPRLLAKIKSEAKRISFARGAKTKYTDLVREALHMRYAIRDQSNAREAPMLCDEE